MQLSFRVTLDCKETIPITELSLRSGNQGTACLVNSRMMVDLNMSDPEVRSRLNLADQALPSLIYMNGDR